MPEQRDTFEGWAILELMGHRRLGGHVREEQIAGAAFIRIDVPDPTGELHATQFYAPAAVYCITPTTEVMALAVAATNQPEPIAEWEIRRALPPPTPKEHAEIDQLFDALDDEHEAENQALDDLDARFPLG